MLQEIIITMVFASAVIYLGRIVYQQLQAKSACTTGCGKCQTVDFNKIEAALKKRGL